MITKNLYERNSFATLSTEELISANIAICQWHFHKFKITTGANYRKADLVACVTLVDIIETVKREQNNQIFCNLRILAKKYNLTVPQFYQALCRLQTIGVIYKKSVATEHGGGTYKIIFNQGIYEKLAQEYLIEVAEQITQAQNNLHKQLAEEKNCNSLYATTSDR